MRRGAFFLLLSLLLLSSPRMGHALTFEQIVRGRILLDVENHGEAWYVYPGTMLRSYLGRPTDAFAIMRSFGLGITNADLENIGIAGGTSAVDTAPPSALAVRLSGRILLQVEEHGEAWYVYPGNLRRYYLGRPDDAFSIMRSLGLGITSANLAKIGIDPGSLTLPENAYTFRSFTITTTEGSFPVSVVTLNKNQVEMVTDTAELTDCERDCAVLPLKTYVEQNAGVVGIHGTYLCPPDYSACAGKINSFLSPVYNSEAGVLINEDTLNSFHRPMIASTTQGDYYFFHRATEFGDSVQDFETTYGVTLEGAIGNWPSLVENGISVTENEPMESGFLVPGTRGGIGFNNDSIFLVIAQNATVPNLASIFLSLGATQALNLDGGGTAALYVDGAYRVGPGRLLPNAIVFKAK